MKRMSDTQVADIGSRQKGRAKRRPTYDAPPPIENDVDGYWQSVIDEEAREKRNRSRPMS